MLNQRLSKIVSKYAILARNYLNERYPVTHLMLPAKQAEKWSTLFEQTVSGQAPTSVAEVLRRLDLGITRPYSDNPHEVDLSAFSIPFVMSSLANVADSTGARIFAMSKEGAWRKVESRRFKASVLNPTKNGRIELAVIGSQNALLSRHSITPWKEQRGVALAPGEHAPVKRMLFGSKRTELSTVVTPFSSPEPTDAVYTWVDSTAPSWRELIKPYKDPGAIDPDRFSHNDELRHSIRSLAMYAPWIRTVYIFSNCPAPDWFVSSDRYRWVMHDEVMPQEVLPTFNSHVIETYLHLLPGLSENFIYLNDDFFLSSNLNKNDFFTAYGQSVARLEPYGVIPYLRQLCKQDRAEEWQHAAVNGANLLQSVTGMLPVQMHRHAPYAFNKTLFQSLLDEFSGAAAVTRAARFRTKDDVSFASFLYHHYALSKGKCVESNENSMIVRHTNYRMFDKRSGHLALRFFCLNDGGGSSSHAEFGKFKKSFLPKLYPFKSEAEKS
ncbi:stealth conserved region 3 domain-containing protein [Neorhizobium sp. NCHU2750]|uniref:stealth conserved region 3 domain-containing protein n=1 Tax=Neorhizobium sp. NCHU2750 TaxID=1825976 RepID=UPI000E732A08|nr:hypothetical protein NCHU2750_01920 [Neorhizobium sp. NCHU2750]